MPKGLRIAVEGNMGAGKSTLLAALKAALPKDWQILDERPEEDPEFEALLKEKYGNTPGARVRFQAWITQRRRRELAALECDPRPYLFERSYLGELVFCAANFSDEEKRSASVSAVRHDIFLALQAFRYNAVIYLDVPPEICFERMQKRARSAEAQVSFDYIKRVHACYEAALPEWADTFNIPVFMYKDTLPDAANGLVARLINLAGTKNFTSEAATR
jgi:deoxyadenosine/deoxycytidine kinase